jgi:hypothetical protein
MNREKKYTPGPWRIWEVNNQDWYVCEQPNSGRHNHFCKVNVGNFWEDEGKANAHLIAAAPCNLKAHEELLQAVLDFINGKPNQTIGEIKGKIENSRKAIAKAYGETE